MQMRVRFSIWRLLGLTLIVALVASNYVAYMRLREVEPALEKLRNEVGELTVRDETQLHAIAVPSFEDATYRWRIHLPKGRQFAMHIIAHDKIPDVGLPEGGSFNTFSTQFFDEQTGLGEVLQTVAVNKDAQGRWRIIQAAGRSEGWQYLPEHFQSWLAPPSYGRSTYKAGKGETVAVDVGEPLILLRIRKTKNLGGGTMTTEPEPTEGLVVWIEEVKKK
jgi:hypothetical protein